MSPEQIVVLSIVFGLSMMLWLLPPDNPDGW